MSSFDIQAADAYKKSKVEQERKLTRSISLLTNSDLKELVLAFDRQGLPMSRRFEGDDRALRAFLEKHEINRLSANFAIVMTAVLRELVSRGIKIQKIN